MKIFISADNRGVAGSRLCRSRRRPGHADYDRARRLMTEEVNAVIEGALAGGASAILVNNNPRHDDQSVARFDPSRGPPAVGEAKAVERVRRSG